MKSKILLYILFTSLLFIGCKKDDGPIAEADGIFIEDVPSMKITKVAGFTEDIIPSSIATYVGKIKVDFLFSNVNPNLTPPEKVDLVMIKNGNKANVKVLKAGITTFPSEITFTGPDLVAIWGPIVTCDAFQVGFDVYANGKKYEAYPAGGVAVGNGGATDANQPGYSVLLNYSTKIEYNPDFYQGNFVVTKDLWVDMSPGDIVVLTKIDATHFSFLYNPSPQYPNGTLLNAQPIIVTVDPVTLTTSVTSQNAGSGWTYDNSVPVTVSTTASANNFVTATCAASGAIVSLNLRWTQGAGTYSNNLFQIKKQ